MKVTVSLSAGKGSKKLPGGSVLFFGEAGHPDSVMIVFDDARFDFDALEAALNLFTTVPKKAMFTRSLAAPTAPAMLVLLKDVLKNLPITKVDQLNKIFTTSFAKDYTRFMGDLQEAINYLQGRT